MWRRTPLVWLFVGTAAFAQAGPEVVRGRVAAPSGAAIVGAVVSVTKTTDGTAQTTRTDTAGSYLVRWPDGSGSYLVQISASGFVSARKILTRDGADSVLVFNVTLAVGQVTELATVVATAPRPVPDRKASGDAGPGAADAVFNPTFASRRLSPDLAGDLNALAAMTPGVLSTASGISVLGLGPKQNLVTLNGLAFPSGDIPRATPTSLHLTTSSYDPSIGWFSGARSNVDLVPGGPFTSRTFYATSDAPVLQFTDVIGTHAGQRYGDLDASLGGSGQLASDRLTYAFGAEAGRKTSSPATLADARADVLEHAGLSTGTAADVLEALRRLNVPVGPAAQSTAQKAAFLGRIDLAPYDWNTLTPAARTLSLTGFGKVTRVDGQALLPTATPLHAAATSQTTGAAQVGYSFYFNEGYLADVRTGLSSVHTSSTPSLAAPDGRVLVGSTPDVSASLTNVQFGGNGALTASSTSSTWESRADVQFYPGGKAIHRVKVTVDSRIDRATQSGLGGQLGAFTYNSLADLQANHPATFTRTLQSPAGTAGAWNAFAAIGDAWHPRSDVQVAYGVRADVSAATGLPAYNSAVDSVFRARTDRGPASWALSPRVGFTFSTATPAWLVPSAPLGVLHGGVGAFRDLLDPSVMVAASTATGLSGGLRQITCAGASVPAASWQSFAIDSASVPRQCTGSNATFADVAPTIAVVDPAFRPPTSWRTNLGWSSSLGGTVYSIDGTLSLNLAQAGTTNLNFTGVPQFISGGEGRSIFAGTDAIVPSNGTVSAAAARRTTTFGAVTDAISDSRSLSRQLTIAARPYLGAWLKRYTGDFALSYTLGDMRVRERGFDGTTFGDPAATYWSRGDLDVRHQFTAGLNIRPLDDLNLFFFGHAQSGLPFTPVIGSDVNGDGLANDRAFVFDPALVDTGMARSLRQLFSNAPAAVRSCLTNQINRPAGPASCDGPWSATLNIAALIDPRLLRIPRATLTVNFANVLGGLDLLAHGSNNLKGWGGVPTPDPVLYRVASFDPAAKRFGYTVNQRFGSASAATTTARTPFRITLDVNVDIGPELAGQQIDRWLAPGRGGRSGTRLSATDLAQRFARSVPNPYTPLLERSDSLALTTSQITALQHADDAFRARMDSVWRDLGATLASLPDRYDRAAAARRADDAVDAAWELARHDVHERLDALLSPVQRSQLSGWTKIMYTATRPLHYKLFIAGS